MPFDYTKHEEDLTLAGVDWDVVEVPDYGRVSFYELARPGPLVSYVGKSFRTERTFLVWPYERHLAFCVYMVGSSRLGPQYGNQGGGVFRSPPCPLPFPNPRTRKPFAYATEISRTEGVTPGRFKLTSQNAQGNDFLYGDFLAAKVTVVYGSLPYSVSRADEDMPTDPDTGEPDESSMLRYVNRTMGPSARHVQYPAGAMKWWGVHVNDFGHDKVTSTQPHGRMIPYCDVTYTWHQVPGLPQAVFTSLGKVNSLTFDGTRPERLLLTGIDLVAHRQITGERAFDIAYRMRFMDGNTAPPMADGKEPAPFFIEAGHNFFLRYYQATPGGDVQFVWDRPYAGPKSGPDPDSDGVKWVFDRVDFRDLFQGPFLTGSWTLI